MKFCYKCGEQLNDEAVFCPKCGVKLDGAYLNDDNNKSAHILTKRTNINNIHTMSSLFYKKQPVKKDIKQKDNKRKIVIKAKYIKRVLISAIILVVAILVGVSIKDDMYRGKLRNIDTDYIEEGFYNIYADLVLIEPVSFVYEYDRSSAVGLYGEGKLEDIICKCETVEGKVFWASFNRLYFPETKLPEKEWNYATHKYSKEEPYRIKGHLKTGNKIGKNVDSLIGDELILDVTDSPDF
ncbi:MAG: zinc ribbon domain-containing protein [Clostridia bacterium]|nr:zinc ribbon domain-containing protein [Clostridia bacterium]